MTARLKLELIISIKYCTTCLKSLCEGCAKRHKRERGTCNHEISPRTGNLIRTSELSAIVNPCPVHSACNASRFCNECDNPCCIKCVDEKHQNHSIISIESKYLECEDKLNDLATNVERNILPALVSNMEQLKEALKVRENGFQDVESEVNRFREELKAAVDERCDKLICDLIEKEIEQISNICDIISDFEMKIRESECFI